jgi:hypothetical protein
MQALCLSVSCDEERAATSELLRDLIRPVVERTGALLQQGTAAAQMLERAVNLLHGACRSADFFTYDTILELVAPVLAALPAALEACLDHNQLTAAVVQLYVVVGEAQVASRERARVVFSVVSLVASVVAYAAHAVAYASVVGADGGRGAEHAEHTPALAYEAHAVAYEAHAVAYEALIGAHAYRLLSLAPLFQPL